MHEEEVKEGDTTTLQPGHLVDDFKRGQGWTVHLICEGKYRQFPHLADFEELPCAVFDALRSVYEHLKNRAGYARGEINENLRCCIDTTQLSAAANVR